jgi:hypothetical protein
LKVIDLRDVPGGPSSHGINGAQGTRTPNFQLANVDSDSLSDAFKAICDDTDPSRCPTDSLSPEVAESLRILTALSNMPSEVRAAFWVMLKAWMLGGQG